MARRVVWSEAALVDLSATADYIARDSDSYARSFVAKVFAAADSLSDLSDRGRTVPEFPAKKIREIFVGSHRLLYQVHPSNVVILALVHASRELARLPDLGRPKSG